MAARVVSRSERLLRELVTQLSNNNTREKTEEEVAAEISKRVAPSKPPSYTGVGEPAALELWIRVIGCDQYNTLDELHQRVAHVWNLGEVVKVGGVGGSQREKRMKPLAYENNQYRSNNNFNHNNNKRSRGHLGPQPMQFRQGGGGNTRPNLRERPQGRPDPKDRHFYCKKCSKDHPGKDCEGSQVKCYHCGKLGHREYECYSKKGFSSQSGRTRRRS